MIIDLILIVFYRIGTFLSGWMLAPSPWCLVVPLIWFVDILREKDGLLLASDETILKRGIGLMSELMLDSVRRGGHRAITAIRIGAMFRIVLREVVYFCFGALITQDQRMMIPMIFMAVALTGLRCREIVVEKP